MDAITHPLALIASVGAVSYLLHLPTWSFFALAFASINIKALPFMYHIRILPSLLRLYLPAFGSSRQKPASSPAALFQPHRMSSRVCALECDINLHKSNSTFFTDLDISRAGLLSSLFSHALRNVGPSSSSGRRRGANIILGGTQAVFYREIKPYQSYEVHSQILTWDAKWTFVVSYFLRTGARLAPEDFGGSERFLKDEKARKKLFAVAVSKYVAKAGRVTLPPAELLEAGGYMPRAERSLEKVSEGKVIELVEEEWSAGRLEEVRLRGLEYMRSFAG